MKRFISSLALVFLVGSFCWADTIYLKDGRKIEGDVIRFENDQFVVQVANPRTRTGYELAYFSPKEIDRIVIDGRHERADSSDQRDAVPGVEKNLSVALSDNWVDTGINLKRGQRVRVDASGTVYLDGRTASGPEGLSGHVDPKSPAPDAPEGILIAAIGENRDAKVFTPGSRGEFRADRDGRLYMTVNKYSFQNAKGFYQVHITTDQAQSTDAAGDNYDRNCDRNTDRNNDRNPDRNSDRNQDRTTDRSTDKNTDRTTDRDYQRDSDNNPDRRSSDSNSSSSRGDEKTVTVRGSDAWTDTGIRVQRGMRLSFSASGEIQVSRDRSADPDGAASDVSSVYNRFPVSNAGVGALIGKIILDDGSETQAFFIGKNKEYTVSQSGKLYLGVNDD